MFFELMCPRMAANTLVIKIMMNSADIEEQLNQV